MKFYGIPASGPTRAIVMPGFQWKISCWGKILHDTDIKKTVDAVNWEDLVARSGETIGAADSEIPKSPSRGVEIDRASLNLRRSNWLFEEPQD